MFSYVLIQLNNNLDVFLIALSKDQTIDNYNCASQTIITCPPRDYPLELCFFPAHWSLAIRVDEKVFKLWTVIGVQGFKCGISFLRERVGVFFARHLYLGSGHWLKPAPGIIANDPRIWVKKCCLYEKKNQTSDRPTSR